MNRAHHGKNVLLGLGLFAAGCVEPPGAVRIVGPDGTSMLHVHCAAEQVACFRLAGERCPYGYDLSPIFDPHDGNFLVRCREPLVSTVAAANPVVPSRSATSSQAAANDGWPPAEVATPTEPWPNAPSNALPPAPHGASEPIDIGY